MSCCTSPLNDDISESTSRVTFERDDGQEYGVGTRVNVHAMNGLFRTLDPNPTDGSYRVTRCERIRDTGWKALRISLHRVNQPSSGVVPLAAVADDRR
jgi:hypothetical protein